MRLLRKIDVCGIAYSVFECAADAPELGDNDGLHDPSSACIYILESHADTVKIDTLLHEVMHAVFSGTGLTMKIQAASEALTGEATSLEEDIIRGSVGGLRAALRSAGWREPKKVGKAPRKPKKKPGPIVPVETRFDRALGEFYPLDLALFPPRGEK